MVQIRAGGPARYPQHLSNLSVGKALDVVEDYHRTRALRKLRQCRDEPPPQLSTLRWISEGGRNRIRELLSVSNLSSPSQIERRVGDDPIQPCSESLRWVEPVQRLMCAQKTFLHRILRILVRHHDRPRHDVGAPLMKTHEPGEPPLVSLFGETYELSFFIRNTYGWVGLLGAGQRLREGVLAIRYGRSPCTGVVSSRGSQCDAPSGPVPSRRAPAPS